MCSPLRRAESGPQGERRREQAPQHRGESDTEPESGDDDESHLLPTSLSKRRGMGWGRDSRFMAANPQANSPATASRAICPAGVPKGLK